MIYIFNVLLQHHWINFKLVHPQYGVRVRMFCSLNKCNRQEIPARKNTGICLFLFFPQHFPRLFHILHAYTHSLSWHATWGPLVTPKHAHTDTHTHTNTLTHTHTGGSSASQNTELLVFVKLDKARLAPDLDLRFRKFCNFCQHMTSCTHVCF